MRTILALLIFASVAMATECKDCSETERCAKHATADKEALDQLKKMLKGTDDSKKIDSLRRFGNACREHENCRIEENALAIASALTNESGRVRNEAAVRLGESQERTLAVKILDAEIEKLLKRLPLAMPADTGKPDPVRNRVYEDVDALLGCVEGFGKSGSEKFEPLLVKLMESHCPFGITVAALHVKEVPTLKLVDAVIAAMDYWVRHPDGKTREGLWYTLIGALKDLTGWKPSDHGNVTGEGLGKSMKETKEYWKKAKETWTPPVKK